MELFACMYCGMVCCHCSGQVCASCRGNQPSDHESMSTSSATGDIMHHNTQVSSRGGSVERPTGMVAGSLRTGYLYPLLQQQQPALQWHTRSSSSLEKSHAARMPDFRQFREVAFATPTFPRHPAPQLQQPMSARGEDEADPLQAHHSSNAHSTHGVDTWSLQDVVAVCQSLPSEAEVEFRIAHAVSVGIRRQNIADSIARECQSLVADFDRAALESRLQLQHGLARYGGIPLALQAHAARLFGAAIRSAVQCAGATRRRRTSSTAGAAGAAAGAAGVRDGDMEACHRDISIASSVANSLPLPVAMFSVPRHHDLEQLVEASRQLERDKAAGDVLDARMAHLLESCGLLAASRTAQHGASSPSDKASSRHEQEPTDVREMGPAAKSAPARTAETANVHSVGARPDAAPSQAVKMLEAGLSRYLVHYNDAMASLLGYKIDGMPQALVGSHRLHALTTSSAISSLLNLSLSTEMLIRHALIPSVDLLRLEVASKASGTKENSAGTFQAAAHAPGSTLLSTEEVRQVFAAGRVMLDRSLSAGTKQPTSASSRSGPGSQVHEDSYHSSTGPGSSKRDGTRSAPLQEDWYSRPVPLMSGRSVRVVRESSDLVGQLVFRSGTVLSRTTAAAVAGLQRTDPVEDMGIPAKERRRGKMPFFNAVFPNTRRVGLELPGADDGNSHHDDDDRERDSGSTAGTTLGEATVSVLATTDPDSAANLLQPQETRSTQAPPGLTAGDDDHQADESDLNVAGGDLVANSNWNRLGCVWACEAGALQHDVFALLGEMRAREAASDGRKVPASEGTGASQRPDRVTSPSAVGSAVGTDTTLLERETAVSSSSGSHDVGERRNSILDFGSARQVACRWAFQDRSNDAIRAAAAAAAAASPAAPSLPTGRADPIVGRAAGKSDGQEPSRPCSADFEFSRAIHTKGVPVDWPGPATQLLDGVATMGAAFEPLLWTTGQQARRKLGSSVLATASVRLQQTCLGLQQSLPGAVGAMTGLCPRVGDSDGSIGFGKSYSGLEADGLVVLPHDFVRVHDLSRIAVPVGSLRLVSMIAAKLAARAVVEYHQARGSRAAARFEGSQGRDGQQARPGD